MSWITDNIQPEIVEYLFNLKITLPNRIGVFQRDIVPDIEVDFELLEEQLQQTPQMICFFNMLLAEQTSKVKQIERRAKAMRGKVAKTILAQDKDIRRTDISDIVNADESIIRIDWQAIKEQEIQDKLEATVDALTKKFEALRSLSGFKKGELKRE